MTGLYIGAFISICVSSGLTWIYWTDSEEVGQ